MKKIKLIFYIFSFTLIFYNNLNADNSQQVDKISKNLRCLICQGQSVYDSQSDFALSMKLLIDKKIIEGKSEKEIYAFLKNKYGEWIVYDSQSDFALSMKTLIDKKINEGKSEKEIYAFLKNKYGEWIVYEPEISQNTILLWVIPLILFIFGGILIVRKVSIK